VKSGIRTAVAALQYSLRAFMSMENLNRRSLSDTTMISGTVVNGKGEAFLVDHRSRFMFRGLLKNENAGVLKTTSKDFCLGEMMLKSSIV
jgi:hypothetical protein